MAERCIAMQDVLRWSRLDQSFDTDNTLRLKQGEHTGDCKMGRVGTGSYRVCYRLASSFTSHPPRVAHHSSIS